MFVSGVGGTGKSFLITTIKSFVGHLWPTDNLTCAVAAPTGLAAFNVGGVTIHRLFQLPVEHEGKTAGYWALSKPSQKFQQCWIPYAVTVQLLKPLAPFRNGSFKGALQTNSLSFGNMDSHLSVFSPEEKHAITSTVICSVI